MSNGLAVATGQQKKQMEDQMLLAQHLMKKWENVKACLSFKTGDCSVDTDDINDEMVSSSQCSTFVNRCQGNGLMFDDFEENGCKFRCQQDKGLTKSKNGL